MPQLKETVVPLVYLGVWAQPVLLDEMGHQAWLGVQDRLDHQEYLEKLAHLAMKEPLGLEVMLDLAARKGTSAVLEKREGPELPELKDRLENLGHLVVQDNLANPGYLANKG